MAVDASKGSLAQLVDFQCASNPDHIALVIDGESFSYDQLVKKTRQLATLLKKNNIQRLGIYARRSLVAYTGILAAHWLGITYVPMNPGFPVQRNRSIAQEAQLDGIVVDDLGLPMITELIEGLQALSVFNEKQIDSASEYVAPSLAPYAKSLAYIMFTSGSTGIPKGVPITYSNLASFIEAISRRYTINSSDKISQFSALTFDVSILDMVLAWKNGAALYVIPETTLLVPASFIHDNALTVWVGVPSVISFMHKLKMLPPNYFSTLKYSIFTGEALMSQQVELWRIAAPTSQIENLYGPTEATIDCIGEVITEQTHYHRDAVPMGKPFTNMNAGLINDNYEFLPLNQQGQLVIAGPQVTIGYWHNDELSAQKFKKIAHPQLGMQTWYLTGDYCYQDEPGTFHYLGRLDNQRKILGNRIELEEIEYRIREIFKNNEIIAGILGNGVDAKIIVVSNIPDLDADEMRNKLMQSLPSYMMPAKYIYKKELFYNSNGKLDRNLMTAWLADHVDGISS